MPRRIAIIEGHPDPDPAHLNYALGAAYESGAKAGGHEVRRIRVSELDFTVLRTRAEWDGTPAPGIAAAQDAIKWADHLVILFPLWLGGMPALLKAFFEQVLRPGFATANGKKLLKGRSARLVITMGMPAVAFRWYYFSHGVKSLERSILAFCGIGPISESMLGGVEGSPAKRVKWLEEMTELGRAGK